MEGKRYQVLIVNSQVDLAAERRAVEETLVGLGAFVSGFSFPRQTDNYLLKLNQLCLADADYVVIITNQQYAPTSAAGVSYVHQLYAAALAKKIPVLSLIYKGIEKTVLNDHDSRLLQEFVSQLKEGYYFEWHNIDGLRHAAERGFEKLIDKHKVKGWHRATGVVTPDSKAILALENQIALLKEALAQERGKKADPLSETEVEIDYQCKAFYGGTMKNLTGNARWSWSRVFLAVAPEMMEQTKENRIRSLLQEQLLEAEKPALNKRLPQAHAFVDLRISTAMFNAIKVNLRAQNLIEVNQSQWKLTPIGEHRLLSHANAI